MYGGLIAFFSYMCVFMFVWMYEFFYICIHLRIYRCIHVCKLVCMLVCMYVFMYNCTYKNFNLKMRHLQHLFQDQFTWGQWPQKNTKSVTEKISFQILTKLCLWMQQTTRPIGNSRENKLFDEILLIEIMITIVELSEKFYGFLRRILVDRAVERNQLKNVRRWHAGGRVEDAKRAKFKWQVVYIWMMVDKPLKITNFQKFSLEESYYFVKFILKREKRSKFIIR